MMKSFALFTFFCFSVLLSGWSGCTDFECTIFPRDFDVSSFSLFFLLNADTDYDRLENSCGENWEGGKNDSPVSHSVLMYLRVVEIDAIVVCLLAYTINFSPQSVSASVSLSSQIERRVCCISSKCMKRKSTCWAARCGWAGQRRKGSCVDDDRLHFTEGSYLGSLSCNYEFDLQVVPYCLSATKCS